MGTIRGHKYVSEAWERTGSRICYLLTTRVICSPNSSREATSCTAGRPVSLQPFHALCFKQTTSRHHETVPPGPGTPCFFLKELLPHPTGLCLLSPPAASLEWVQPIKEIWVPRHALESLRTEVVGPGMSLPCLSLSRPRPSAPLLEGQRDGWHRSPAGVKSAIWGTSSSWGQVGKAQKT